MCMKEHRVIVLVVLICVSGCLSFNGRSNPWTYVSGSGRNDSSCIRGGKGRPCTLDYVSCVGGPSISFHRIEILDSKLELISLIKFEEVSHVLLTGRKSMSELQCTCTDDDSECGLVFERSCHITIQRLTITGCGSLVHGVSVNKRMVTLRAALVISNCHTFALKHSNISRNYETGLAIKDTSGEVKIQHSTFQRNGETCINCEDAHGIWITFNTSCYDEVMHSNCSIDYTNHSAEYVNSNYSIQHCCIRENYNHNDRYFSSSGGGIRISFNADSAWNFVSIEHTDFVTNEAAWGGGLFIIFDDQAAHNRIVIYNALFFNNSATKSGGGLDIGYLNQAAASPIRNSILVENCNFTENTARSGGGTTIFSSPTTCFSEDDNNHTAVLFKGSKWYRNKAFFSSAVNVSPYDYDALGSIYLPHPKFTNCTFMYNERQFRNDHKLVNSGSFAIFGFAVHFDHYVRFEGHQSSALHVTEGDIIFLPGTTAIFCKNTGSQGGAIFLQGSSILHVNENTSLYFHNNSARDNGGAIFYNTQNHHDFITSRTCFLRATWSQTMPTFTFIGNKASQAGDSIYATTFLPCYFQVFGNTPFAKHTVEQALQRIANFNFYDNVSLATTGMDFDFFDAMPLLAIPGRIVHINLQMRDELNNTVPSVFRVGVNESYSSTMSIDRQYTLGDISVKGLEESSGYVSLKSVGFRESMFTVAISIQQCPPGFYFNDTSLQCTCSALSMHHSYNGIYACNNNKAHFVMGFWVGYDTNQSLLTATCPLSFCAAQYSSQLTVHSLPQSADELEGFMCNKHRQGWLCGKCTPNFTIYYHSPTCQCGPETLCHVGFVFYFLSEIVPIAIIFTIIVVCDLKFTDGTVSGFVFFSQIADTLSHSLKGKVVQSKLLETLSCAVRIIYGLFNFDFFNIDSLSYCLWKNATVLDMISFRYVSVVFAFCLLLIFTFILHHCSYKQASSEKKKIRVSWSMIHGMSAILIMCYGQCTEVSFQILTKATLRGAGRRVVHDVTYLGGIHYMSREHLLYALPALACVFTIIVPPPLLLVVYPAILKLMSSCRLNRVRALSFISKLFIRLKPFLDSFQGCYRDNFRFFSGLYFIVRVVILAASAFLSSTLQSILIIQLIILLMLGAHSLVQPFQKKHDNTSNGLILLNIGLVNSLTLFVHIQWAQGDLTSAIQAVLWIRLLLMCLPLACAIGYAVRRVVLWELQRRKKAQDSLLMMDDVHEQFHDQIIDHTYLPFQELDHPERMSTDLDVDLSERVTTS